MLVDKNKVKDLIPQQEPFVMIDNLLVFTETTLLSNFKVSPDNLFVDQSFFVEGGIIENMAQSVALHTGYHFFLLGKKAPVGYIGSIKNVEINRLPSVGEVLETSVSIIKEFSGVTLVDVEVKINSELIAKGQMKTVLA